MLLAVEAPHRHASRLHAHVRQSVRRVAEPQASLRRGLRSHGPVVRTSVGCAWSTLCLDTTNAGFGAGQEKGPLSAPNERLGNHFWSTRGKGKGKGQ